MDWEIGDVALCINDELTNKQPGRTWTLRKGREYIVMDVVITEKPTFTPFSSDPETGKLNLCLLGTPNPWSEQNCYDARRFVKQRPQITRDEIEKEKELEDAR